ncbi:MAG: RecQ family ATP-dependent DNA helicase [Ktedonobacteraceae bacterium]
MPVGATWQGYSPQQLLWDRFRISGGFHEGQLEIIEQLAQGKRILAIQHTGWGKSLCYQMASLYYPHLTLVFSPLKALMRDQCQRCNDVYAIPAAIVSSDFSDDENRATLEQAAAGNLKILFLAPERLNNALWQSYVQKMRISMIVIDEAHCISTWGHDFRPDYRRIVRMVQRLPERMPILALTATVNRRIEDDILQQIGTMAQVMRGTMQRPNLYVNVEALNGDPAKLSYLAEILPHVPGAGIVYTATKHDAEMVASFLQQRGIAADYYHAGRDDETRQEIEQGLMTNRYKVICSTVALGMGIDKPDIRFVIHYQIPASPIHYYQEMGRAGRDGDLAWCVLLYDPTDQEIHQHFIESIKPPEQHYKAVLALAQASSALSESDMLLATGCAQTPLRIILAELVEQGFLEYEAGKKRYKATGHQGPVDYSTYGILREEKRRELDAMLGYAQCGGCYIEYLTTYLGDMPGSRCQTCGHCRPANFPPIRLSESIQMASIRFLEKDFLPRIEKRRVSKGRDKSGPYAHEAGWALAYHSKSHIGKMVSASKYGQAGPFALHLVYRAVEVIRSRYPIATINGIVSVPPTSNGTLVEDFARWVAAQLGIAYLPALTKIRATREQKECTNRLQKQTNVEGAFAVYAPERIVGRTLLLIDDIYDSGYMLREVGQTLMRTGARAVYPFAITKTTHSDDQ